MLWVMALSASQTAFAEETVTKVKYPVKGYRNFWEIGVSQDVFKLFYSFDEGKALEAQFFTMIHGCQIMPQLFVGIGNTFELQVFNVSNKKNTEDKDFDYFVLNTYFSVRYDIIQWAITPYVEGRIGRRDYFNLRTSKPNRLYVAPIAGVRLRHFNLGVSLENSTIDPKIESSGTPTHYYHVKKTFLYPVFHMSFDFGARRLEQ